ncbi:MAG: CPBP family intramembrane glutamic endopeptidase [Candidatus Ranarchaeia archaeon]
MGKQISTEPSINNKNQTTQLVLFFIILICGVIALGPIRYGNILIPLKFSLIYQIRLPIGFLILSFLVAQSEKFAQYQMIFTALFIGTTAFLFAWVRSFFFPLPVTTIEGFALNKVVDAVVIGASIIVLSSVSGVSLSSLFLQQGNLKKGLSYGLVGFVGFAVVAIPRSILLFSGQGISLSTIILWLPWIMAFVFGNAVLEELMYRGLFLQKYGQFFSGRVANLLQALIFSSIHVGVTYTSSMLLFVGMTFVLGIVWGYMVQRTDSLLGSILFHAGTDIAIILGIFVAL